MSLRSVSLPILMALVFCVSCARAVYKETISIPTKPPEVVQIDTIPTMFRDSMFWEEFWLTRPDVGGVTMCFGQRLPLVKFNPSWPTGLKRIAVAHEAIHELQVYRDGCPKWNEMARDNAGSILLEAEAFSRGNGMSGEILLQSLMYYDEAQAIGRDSVMVLIKEWY